MFYVEHSIKNLERGKMVKNEKRQNAAKNFHTKSPFFTFWQNKPINSP